ncbi:hypothetical protein J1784_22835 [Rahnella sp. FRB 231]|uniref:PAAR motif-containing protein n=1 Tax=Rahnella ecdela TaxID=2816250 RepID=A0ABS6LLV1_9GAMM|nr:hypothetical protein [Rahnella ecdela]
MTIDGFPTTLIGMRNIIPKGPHQQLINGVPIVLEGDVVACGCPEGANVVMPLTARVTVK